MSNNKKGIPKLLIVSGIAISIVALIVIIYFLLSNNSNKLICKSDKVNITLMYNDTEVIKYKSSGIDYNFEQQKSFSKEIGIKEYISQFSNWFETSNGGSCNIKEK